jgi:hypothetical protein
VTLLQVVRVNGRRNRIRWELDPESGTTVPAAGDARFQHILSHHRCRSQGQNQDHTERDSRLYDNQSERVRVLVLTGRQVSRRLLHTHVVGGPTGRRGYSEDRGVATVSGHSSFQVQYHHQVHYHVPFPH